MNCFQFWSFSCEEGKPLEVVQDDRSTKVSEASGKPQISPGNHCSQLSRWKPYSAPECRAAYY